MNLEMTHLLEPWLSGAEPWVYTLVDTGLILSIAFGLQLVLRRLLNLAISAAKRTRNIWDLAALKAVKKPVLMLFWGVAISTAVLRVAEYAGIDELVVLELLRRIVLLISLTWFGLSFVGNAESAMLSDDSHQSQFDQTTISAFCKALKTAISLVGVLLILQALEYNISSLLAVGSIGGIAISLAARDLLANFFGGLMIYMDRPFSVGDWVRSPDREIEGVVEHIGWRRTVIRTFDKRPLYVPNSTFNNIALENPSRMENRRIYETIGVRYVDSDNIAAIVDDVKKMLLANEHIDTKQTMIVNMNRFADSSIEFFIYTYTKTTNWVEFHGVKQDILMQVHRIIEQYGAEIAFPTQSLYVVEPDSKV